MSVSPRDRAIVSSGEEEEENTEPESDTTDFNQLLSEYLLSRPRDVRVGVAS